jgi:hypothetical protein
MTFIRNLQLRLLQTAMTPKCVVLGMHHNRNRVRTSADPVIVVTPPTANNVYHNDNDGDDEEGGKMNPFKHRLNLRKAARDSTKLSFCFDQNEVSTCTGS